MKFKDFVEAQDKKFDRDSITHLGILCFDPGHTTGWAYFFNNELQESGQIDTKTMEVAPFAIRELFEQFKPTFVVCEDYRIYEDRAKHHAGSEVHTTHVIGTIETLCAFNFIPHIKRMAALAKNFCTDKKLQEWGYYVKGERHARDAIRHGCYHILFHHNKQDKRQGHYKKVVG